MFQAEIAKQAFNIGIAVVASALSALVVQRATVLHTFEAVPEAQRAAIRFCPDDPWRLTVKNLSFIPVQDLKIAYVHTGLPKANIETDRDWVLYPNGPTDRKDSGRYFSWEFGNVLAGEAVNIVFCFPKGLSAEDVLKFNGRERTLLRTGNANSINVTGSSARSLVDMPVLALIAAWLAMLVVLLWLCIKLFSWGAALWSRLRKPPDAPAPTP